MGLGGKIWFGTFDFSEDIAKVIQNGTIKFAIDQQPYLQGCIPVAVLAISQKQGVKDPAKIVAILPEQRCVPVSSEGLRSRAELRAEEHCYGSALHYQGQYWNLAEICRAIPLTLTICMDVSCRVRSRATGRATRGRVHLQDLSRLQIPKGASMRYENRLKLYADWSALPNAFCGNRQRRLESLTRNKNCIKYIMQRLVQDAPGGRTLTGMAKRLGVNKH